ncbi:MAG: asparagine--tRNA ligase, partial [Tissierellales bacterium]|nr:asparagine--tRNA ligase [Tissierellales bacterium]
DNELSNNEDIRKCTTGTALSVNGELVKTPNAKQDFEIQAEEIQIIAYTSEDYPLQKKRHTFEYLRKIAHLRPRTNTFSAAFRVRSTSAYAIHKFFQEKDFVYLNSPIITSNDAEGAGEMFNVTTLNIEDMVKNNKDIDYSEDFFGKKTNLSVSGQLEAEAYALAFKNVYTFGPTFRAENSNTKRHASEFWMIEPEMAFADINDDMDTAEEMIKFIINYVMEHNIEEIEFFNKFIDKKLIDRLNNVRNSDFERITYTKAIQLLEEAKEDFEFPVKWGIDLQTEHERYITEKVYNKPVFVTDYPKEIKAFYMKLNNDNKTVAAVDLLVPGVGELIGGSQREDSYEKLVNRMGDMNIPREDLEWYLDLRKFGCAPHSGFGLGFERLIMYLTGLSNIRDVIPFPRTPKNADF